MIRRSVASLALAAAASACALWCAPAARADYAVLRSGERLHITSYEVDGDQVTLHLPGGQVQIAATSLLAVEPEDTFPALPPSVTVVPAERYADLIHTAAERHGVDEKLVKLVVEAESNFDPKAVSRKNALGLMQLLPSTAARYSVRNVFDPAQNIEAGTHYLKDLLDRYRGNTKLALAAYNAGPEMVDRYGGVPPFAETQQYVRGITSKLAAEAVAAVAKP
jgi:soluble lytic murein transglycosylase-like protein